MNPVRILVVEDTPVNLELVVDLLEAAGHTVLTAEAAEPGIALARREVPDLILMDVDLPGIDGLAATRLLKQDPATRAIPVIALTAHAMPQDERDARCAGCVGYLTKPIDTRRFVAAVTDLLAVSQASSKTPS